MNTQKTSPVKIIFLILAILLCVVIIAAGVLYLVGVEHYKNIYLPNTYVNSISIGGLTEQQAESKLSSATVTNDLTFVPKSGDKIVFKGSDFDYKSDIDTSILQKAADEKKSSWFGKMFTKTEYTPKFNTSYSEEKLKNLIENYSWGTEEPKDAEITDTGDGNYTITPEDNGNYVEVDKLEEYALKKIADGENTINMEDSGCYKTASVTEEDLKPQLELYNKVGNMTVTLDMTDREKKLDPLGTAELDTDSIRNMCSVENNELQIDTSALKDWVQKNVCDKYDSLVTGYSAPFESTMQGTVDLAIGENGIYGWRTDTDSTVNKIETQINSGESATIEPDYIQEGWRKSRGDNTYIEIDITNQHLWFYKNGETVVDDDVVTGLKTDPKRQTPPGRYHIWGKESPSVLGKYEVQGYEAHVDYWMPIDGTGVGLHDLYHAKYGGDVYTYEGSHGCINLSDATAKKIYENVEEQTPVFIIP